MIGYDSDNLDDIPSSAELVLYYADSEPGSATPQQLARFPTAHLYSITRNLTHQAYFGDVEPGCIWPVSAAASAYHSGLVKALYCAESNWPSLRAAVNDPSVPYWIGAYPDTYPTDPTVPQSWIDLGCIMWQFAGSPGTSPGHYDQSVTAPGFPPLPPPVLVTPPSLLLIGSIHATH